MKKLMMTVTLLGTTLLSGCFEDKPKKSVTPQKVVVEITQPKKEEIHTVTWFKEHQEERQAMLASCRDNPGELENSPNCVNAMQAENELDAEKRGGLGVKRIENIYEIYQKALKNNSSKNKK
ncbi:EexN family lipoprotein [unidentified bacterial endosymbiont]|uniref:EexN family lipoprotein n=1 Tax=unidentified bacterial endosymbiont TaxID=2355 RepID=UPI00209FEC4B|nr:EexN family lipoprotein [unidentified bacterial endosymbiont]